MNSSGIYFGPRLITFVEIKGRKLVKSIQIPQPAIANELEAKASVEVTLIQLVALVKEELRKKQIEAKRATLCLSGKDLIIRTFEIPLLPRSELKSAVNFEARKYIPFKGEDIISDFQIEFDSANKTNQILFIAIKKQSLERYVSLLEQLGIEISGIEYSAFSLLKLLKLAGPRDSNITAVISADLRGDDEANFLVLKNGFPLFSRDFAMFSEADFMTKIEKAPDSGMAMEKFKTEIRVSLDYFHRKFSDKNIQKVTLIANPEYHNELGAFMKELNLPVQFVDYNKVNKILGDGLAFKLDVLKSYSAALLNIRTKLKLRLLSVRAKTEGAERAFNLDERLKELLTNLKVDLRVVLAAILICLMTFGFGILRILPFKKEAGKITTMRPKTDSIDSASSYEELVSVQKQYQDKLNSLDRIIKERPYLTEVLNTIPRVAPEGLWLVELQYKCEDNTQRELSLRGSCYLGERGKELEVIDKFLSELRNDAGFKKLFQEIKIISVERKETGDTQASNFIISAKGA